MENLKQLFKRIQGMHIATYLLLKWSVILSCVCVAAAIALHILAYNGVGNLISMMHISKELGSMPLAILLLASIASVCMEELVTR